MSNVKVNTLLVCFIILKDSSIVNLLLQNRQWANHL